MKNIFFLLIGVCFLMACGNEKAKVEALAKETSDLHDAAMKDMAEMNRVARSIKEFLISASMTPEQSGVYMQALETMGKAENDMLSWMQGYKDPTDMPAEEAMAYLKDQKAKIEKNYADIKAATEAGKKLLPGG